MAASAAQRGCQTTSMSDVACCSLAEQKAETNEKMEEVMLAFDTIAQLSEEVPP
jgi:hypothetical protein